VSKNVLSAALHAFLANLKLHAHEPTGITFTNLHAVEEHSFALSDYSKAIRQVQRRMRLKFVMNVQAVAA